MRLATLFFLFGVILFQQCAELPGRHWLFAAVLLPLVKWWLPVRLPMAILAGFLWAFLHAAWMLSGTLPGHLEGVDIEVEGVIASLVEEDFRRTRFEFNLDSLTHQQRVFSTSRRVLLSWYGETPALSVGDRWRLTVRLKQPHGFMNPGGFDYEKWLFQQRINATGYVRTKAAQTFLASEWQSHPVDRLRQHLRQLMDDPPGNHPYTGLVTALAIGDRNGIPNDQWEVMTRTGTSHLMAISGLHIGLVAGIAFFLGRHIWSLLGRAPLLVPAPRAAAVIALLAACAYAALAGFSIPTQRALIMIAVVMAALLLQRQVNPSQGLGLALGGVLLLDPMAVVTAGFWLSFAAVAVILYGLGGRLHRKGGWRQWGRVQWVVSLGLLPLLAFSFQQAPLLSPLANLIAVPWVSFTVVPLTLLGIAGLLLYPPLGSWLLLQAANLLGWLWPVLQRLAEVEFAQWQLNTEPPLWILLAAVAGTLWMLAPRGVQARWVGAGWLLPLVLTAPERPQPGEAWFTLLDVGQGLAAVVQTRNHTLVYDTGPKFSDHFDTGQAVIVPFLRREGVANLDMLIVGHGDSDHIGGADSLLRRYPARRLLTTVPEKLPGDAELCRQGQTWSWDGVRFSILHPAPGSTTEGNNASCVLKVETAAATLLLTGDIERQAERQLASRTSSRLAATIMVAPHHGSKTSSSLQFIDTVNPDYVLFPVGYRNRFHHPHPTIVERYLAKGVQMLNSARHGAIRFKMGKTKLSEPESYRTLAQRYWNNR